MWAIMWKLVYLPTGGILIEVSASLMVCLGDFYSCGSEVQGYLTPDYTSEANLKLHIHMGKNMNSIVSFSLITSPPHLCFLSTQKMLRILKGRIICIIHFFIRHFVLSVVWSISMNVTAC